MTEAGTSHLDPEKYLANLGADGPGLAAAAETDLTAPVPGCPDWNVAALVGHTALIHRWVSGLLGARATEPMSRRDIGPPPEGGAVLEWYRAGLAGLMTAFGATGPDEPVWNFITGVSPARFWYRRMAAETAVHRWDAQSAVGTPAPIDPALAVDGIDELLGTFAPRLLAGDGPRPDLGGSLHVHSTDAEGEWTVEQHEDGWRVVPGHAKGDAAVRGPASDLFLALWGRPTIDALEVFGDRRVLDRWREIVRF
ncbi:MAG TPA: maleylpyruvate isomerase family mycothiol-dependent enzyme [Acidimicrobiales bacterium]|nr:maleylpyruvate isomerase family mycothiol-dependent enzyme [Acidimicrobiales bacterium]